MFLFFSFLLFISFNVIIIVSPNFNFQNPKREDFQTEIDGKKVDLYFLTNNNGYEISITNYGGTIVSIMFPNNKNQFENIIQGITTLRELITKEKKNSIFGPYANKIKIMKLI